jgi:thiamine-phosphate pyrophosphorylase
MLKIIITYPSSFPTELEQIIQVLEKDDCRLHLRKPDYSEEEYEALLQAIPAKFHAGLVLHDYYYLAEKYKVGGLHFSTNKRIEINRSAYKQINLTCSTSTHSIEELQELDGQFDYAFLSPIFPSISKKGYEGNLDMETVQVYLQKPHQTKVIALGGIDETKIPQIEAWGFDGYAQLGNIWKLMN